MNDREEALTAEVDTRRLSKEAFEAVGTSIQNAAGGVDYNLPEYVVIAITENLIASTWLRQRLRTAEVERLRERAEWAESRVETFIRTGAAGVIAAERDAARAAVESARVGAWDEGNAARVAALETWFQPPSAERMYWPDPVNPYRAALDGAEEASE